MKKADLFFNVLRLPIDFLMLLMAGGVTYILRTKLLAIFRPALFEFNLPLVKYLYLVIFVSLLFIAAFAVSGLYSMKIRIGRAEEFLKITVAASAGIMAIIIYIFLRQTLFNSRFLVLGGWFFGILFVFIGRMIIRQLQVFFVSKHDFGVNRLMVIGNDAAALKIVEEIKSNPATGYRIIKHLASPELEEIKTSVGNPGVDEVILTSPDYPATEIVKLVDFCNENHLIFKFVPNIYQTLTTNFDVDVINGLPLIELKRTALDGWGKILKRITDIIGAIVGLIVFSPIFLITAVSIKLDTSGPVFARLKRVSKNKEFLLYKFRSMIAYDPDGGAESLKASLVSLNERKDGPLFKIKNDPRITRVGKVIRKYRIDELAQFINILKGDMSLVGPRPHQPDEIAQYQKHHKRVLAIKAGATGLAQVSGSSDLPFDQEVALDTFYIENWSLLTDFKIILKTLVKVFTDKSAV